MASPKRLFLLAMGLAMTAALPNSQVDFHGQRDNAELSTRSAGPPLADLNLTSEVPQAPQDLVPTMTVKKPGTGNCDAPDRPGASPRADIEDAIWCYESLKEEGDKKLRFFEGRQQLRLHNTAYIEALCLVVDGMYASAAQVATAVKWVYENCTTYGTVSGSAFHEYGYADLYIHVWHNMKKPPPS